MRSLLMSLVIVALVAGHVDAQPSPAAQPPPGTESFEVLKKEYEAATEKWLEEYRKERASATTAGTEKTFKPSKEHPAVAFSPRFLAIAEKDPMGPMAVEAIRMALDTSGGPKWKTGTWSKAIALLKRYYVTRPEIKRTFTALVGWEDEAAEELMDEVIATNPDRQVQALAVRERANLYDTKINSIRRIKGDANWRKLLEERAGKEFVANHLAQFDTYNKRLEELKKTLDQHYSGLFADLSIGQPVPGNCQPGHRREDRQVERPERQGRRHRFLEHGLRPMQGHDPTPAPDGRAAQE